MNLTIPCLIDDLDNAADLAYQAWPDKIYVVRSDGVIAVAGEDGPTGFPKAFEQAEAWLAEYRELGFEPAIIPTVRDFQVIVANELKPTGHQDELLNRLQQYREALNTDDEATASLTTTVAKTPVTPAGSSIPAASPAAVAFRVRPWHIAVLLGSVVLVGWLVARWNARGPGSPTA